MKQSKLYLTLLIFISSLHTCLYGQTSHVVKIITGSTNNRLEVIDWGGKGKPILFLTGLSNTAHVYDHFAPRFTKDFHVYGMSRRGYGMSEQTNDGYGIDTLASDILAVIDALKLDKIILIGHSIAGDEITKFVTQHPNRVSEVIYLDAAYSHVNSGKLPFPSLLKRTTRDSTSVQSFNNYLKRARGFTFPVDEIKHQYVFSEKGMLVKTVTSATIGRAIVQGVTLPNYSAIKSPALAIYGQRNTAQQYFAAFPLMDSVNQQKAINEFMPAWKSYYNEEISRFKSEKPDGWVKEIPGADHYVFLTHPDETEKLIRAFLK